MGANGEVTLTWSVLDATEVAIVTASGRTIDVGDASPASGSVQTTIASDTTFRLTAKGPGGSTVATASVDVVAAPAVTFAAPAEPVNPGASVTLTWSATNAARVTITDAAGTTLLDETAAAEGTLRRNPATTETLTLTATGAGGTTTRTATVQVKPVIERFVLGSEGPVRAGDEIELSWRARGATSGRLSNENGTTITLGEDELAEGTRTLPAGPSGVFTLTLASGGVDAVAVQTIPITLAPRIHTFAVDEPQLTGGPGTPALAQLSWFVDGAEQVQIVAEPGGLVDITGLSMRIDEIGVPVTATTTFEIIATSRGGTASATATVTLTPMPHVALFDALPRRVAPGEGVPLSWQVTDAAAIRIERDGQDIGVDPALATGTHADPLTTAVVGDTVTYVLHAQNALGFEVQSDPLAIGVGAPLVAFSVDRPSAAAGSTVNFSWQSVGGHTLELLGPAGQTLCSSQSLVEIAEGSCNDVPVSRREAHDTFTLRVTNGLPGAELVTEEQITVEVVGGPVIQQFAADKTELTAGDTITFTAVVDPDADGVTPTVTLEDDLTPPTQYAIGCTEFSACTFTVTPTEGGISAFTLRASTPGTTPPAPQTLPITVHAQPAIASVGFTPEVVQSTGGTAQSTLAWTTSGGANLEVFEVIDGAETSVFATADAARLDAGSEPFSLTPGIHNYRVELTNPVGVATSATATVMVDPAAVDTFTADRTQVLRGETIELTWTTTNADRVALTPFQADLTTGTSGFVDISTSPTVRDVATSSATSWINVVFPTGFTFPWYGNEISALRMFAYGYLSFDTGAGTTTANGEFPRSVTVQTRDVQIAPFWDLMNRVSTAKTLWDERTDANGRKALVFQWVGMQFPAAQAADNPSNLNFQVVLWEDGDFEYHYGVMQGASAAAQGAGATIGYQSMPDANNVNHYGYTFSSDTAFPDGLSNLSLYFDAQLPADGTWTVKPWADTTYELQAINGHTTATRTLDVQVFDPAGITAVVASATEQDVGENVRINWSTSNATAVEVVDAGGAVRCTAAPDAIAAGGCNVTEAVAGTYVYTVRVHGNIARDVVEQTVTVDFVEPLVGTLTAGSTIIDPGGTTTLSWQVAGAVSASITANGQPFAAATIPTGSIQVTPVDSTTYVLTVEAADGRTSTSELTVWVRSAQLTSVSPSTQVAPGTVVPISWTGTGGNVTITPRQNPQEITGTVAYEDISTTGTTIELGTSGSTTSVTWTGTVPFPQGFTFPFGGVDQTQATVGACGWLTFTNATANASNAAMPNAGRHMAVFWDLIYARASNHGTGDVFYELRTDARGEYLIIQWHNQRFSTSANNVNDSLNFQVVLRENGDFEYRYGTMFASVAADEPDARGKGATIGTTSLDNSTGITFSHNFEHPQGLQGRAFRFSNISAANDTHYVAPTETTTYEVCIHSDTGNYTECRDVTVTVVQPGDLLFTELMIDPVGTTEWVELRNFAPYPIDLSGMTLRSIGEPDYVVSPTTPLVVDSGESVVLANGPDVAGSVFAGIVLDNALDAVELRLGAGTSALVVDSVAWSSWPVQTGVSFSLDGLAARRGRTAGNDTIDAWCTVSGGNPGLHGPTCSSTWYDVDSSSGAPFIDIANSPLAVQLTSAAGGTAYEQVPGGLGFTMPFFGDAVSDLWVSRHGYTSFLPLTSVVSANANIPTTGVPNGTVAAFWDSMVIAPSGTSAIWTELRRVSGRTVRIVQWNDFHPTSSTTGKLATFQSQIWSDGEIVTVVRDTDTAVNYNRGSSSTLGLENLAGNAAVKYSYNEEVVFPGLSIRYTPKAAPAP